MWLPRSLNNHLHYIGHVYHTPLALRRNENLIKFKYNRRSPFYQMKLSQFLAYLQEKRRLAKLKRKKVKHLSELSKITIESTTETFAWTSDAVFEQ